uniref:Uncharacterized protein n=1 Tax=Schizaphis graminum TaxID=13262 RepID=A0A2S2NM16_SCHGA
MGILKTTCDDAIRLISFTRPPGKVGWFVYFVIFPFIFIFYIYLYYIIYVSNSKSEKFNCPEVLTTLSARSGINRTTAFMSLYTEQTTYTHSHTHAHTLIRYYN